MSMKFLVPVDGSESASQVVDYLVQSAAWLKQAPEIYLLNVQWKVAAGNVKLFISQDTINAYYREQGLAELASARAKLDAAQLPYEYHISIGTPAEAIVKYAEEQGIDQIVMSKQGQSGVQSWLLGSVVSKVLHLASCPVLVK
jgi:nucleotide-binding universal stress UspA family protein